MEEWLLETVARQPAWGLALIIAVSLLVLGKGADLLVDEAVALSIRCHIPKAVIGATVVSLGTTLPEVAVSVLAAVQGNPGLALGNAVGSVICNTGLILGLAVVICPMTINRKLFAREGRVLIAAALLLVAASVPYADIGNVFSEGGGLSRSAGFVFLALLAGYLFLSMRWGRGETVLEEGEVCGEDAAKAPGIIFVKLATAVFLVIAASRTLIPAASEAAYRMHVPEGVIAATLVAFGTSLPELVTVVTASLKGHSDLGVGNVIGANILNVLFVAGASAAVTAGGLHASPEFFTLLFPGMLAVLAVFLGGALVSGAKMGRPLGFILIFTYVAVTVASYRI